MTNSMLAYPLNILVAGTVVVAFKAHEGAGGGVIAGPTGGLGVLGVVHAEITPVPVQA